ncbi:ankyrin repeat-containing protein BDA1-like [Quercus robur]|uniref:ankyrin repeat-containing protein BDA1-like n=1 Tax=Quercus robur TaxID=38942 RepID=UPI0021611D28|nr:ankyrin repeat-containing protein BDA1-like [Quercus robur]
MSTSSNMDEGIERMNQAAQHGNIDAFYIIIQKDVKLLKHTDKLPFLNTPLHIAAYAGHIPFAMELMILKPSFSRKLNPDGFSPIHLALQNGHGELVCRLLEIDGELFRVKGREGITPLHYVAATECHLDRLEKFLEFCPHSIEAVTIRNENALHIALKYDKLEAFRLLVRWLQKNWSQNSILWKSKVLNWQDENGNTPLHIAVYKNQPKCEIRKYKTEMQELALRENLVYHYILQAVRRLLLYSGVNTFAKNSEGKTAGDILAQQNQIENREIKVMLRCVGALRAPSLPKVTFYARNLWSMFSSLEKTRMHCIGEWTQISDDRRNMLLVVATLLMTVTYQGVLSPPGGLWQDD